MTTTTLKVGELAKRTGLTVRTLHHWDAIGLLPPSRHSAAGHRLYTAADVARLHQIRTLRLLGFGLEDIGGMLAQRELPLGHLIRRHLARLDQQIAVARQLKGRLEQVAQRLDAAESLSVDELIDNMELMNMYEKYFDQEQQDLLARRRQEVGEAVIQGAQDEWPRLIAEVRALVDAGVAPEDPRAAPLAARWMALVESFTGGQPAIAQSVQRLYEGEPEFRQQQGLDPALFTFVRAAHAAARKAG